MRPVLFEVGGLTFYSFGAFIALGTIAAGLFLLWAARRRRMKTHHFFDTVLFTLIAGLVGARLVYYFLYQDQFTSFAQIFHFWQGGLVAFGGLIVGFLVFLYFIKREHDPVWQVLDAGALALLLGWAIGKYGCHLSGCITGRTTESFLAVNGTFPVDLLGAIFTAGLFAIMLIIWLKNRLSDGVVFFISIEALLLGDLLIKTLRADFGNHLIRIEALFSLTLIIALYLIFWKLHGPKFEKNRLGLSIRNFVFRRKDR